jgi:hypothetical protein
VTAILCPFVQRANIVLLGSASAMSSNPTILALPCQRCQHGEARLFVRSKSILTVTCTKCGHTWAVEIAALPEHVRAVAQLAVLPRSP